MNRRAGFTLFELMIVVTVIALIASFAIPSLLGSFKGGKEAAAISSMRTLATVSEQYSLRFGRFAGSLNQIAAAGYIDTRLGSGTKSGYTFEYSATPYNWQCNAGPEDPGTTGDRYFFVDQTGVIYENGSAPATSNDTPID